MRHSMLHGREKVPNSNCLIRELSPRKYCAEEGGFEPAQDTEDGPNSVHLPNSRAYLKLDGQKQPLTPLYRRPLRTR